MTITSTPTPTVERHLEPACPPWCAGHGHGYQDWEYGNDARWERGHDEEGAAVGPVTVILSQIERADGMDAPGVTVYSDDLLGSPDLSEDQAREVARLILNAADRAKVLT